MRGLKRRVAMLLAAAMLVTSAPQVTYAASDTSNHWASQAIERWEQKGVLKGYADGTFKPKNTLTRAEFAQVLVRIFGYTEKVNAKAYTDTVAGKWYEEAIALVSAAGVMYEEGDSFRPDAAITREEAAFALATAYKLQDSAEVSFTDAQAISAWAMPKVAAMSAKGYVKGTPGGSFNPQGTLTRAELVTMIDNMTSNIVNAAGTYTEDVQGNLVVNTRDVILKDMTVEGNLYLAAGIGDGDVTLEGITVKGQVIVEGGGINSIKSKYSNYYNKFVVSAENPVRIVVEGDKVKVEAMPGATLTLTGAFETVEVAPNVNLTIKDAKVDTVIAVPATQDNKGEEAAKISIEGSATVNTLQADEKVEVKGKVENLIVNAQGVTTTEKPNKVEIKDADTKVTIAGKEESKETISKEPSGGGSGGSSGSSGGSSGSSGGSSGGSGGSSGGSGSIQEKYRISGKVTYQGEAVEGATVNLIQDSEGYKVLESIWVGPSGEYSIYAKSGQVYALEAWVTDKEGYGYHISQGGIRLDSNKTINLELVKKHVVNFNVVDKNNKAIRDIKIEPIINGKQDGWSYTDNFGEATRYLWDEKATYGFKFYMDEKIGLEEGQKELVHEIKEEMTITPEYKQDITVKLDQFGIESKLVGKVVDEKGQPLAHQKVYLNQVVMVGPWETNTINQKSTLTDALGNYTFDALDASQYYTVEVRYLGEDGNYYTSKRVDVRFAATTPLKVRKTYGVKIKVVDKDNKPVEGANVGIAYEQGGQSDARTNASGVVEIYRYNMEMGNHVATARIGDQVVAHRFTITPDQYNYDITLKLDNYKSDKRVIAIKFDTTEVKIGDHIIKADGVSVYGYGWDQWTRVENGAAQMLVSGQHQDTKVNIRVYGTHGEMLYMQDGVDFPADTLDMTIDLNATKISAKGEVLLTTQSAIGVLSVPVQDAEVKLSIRGMDAYEAVVGTYTTDAEGKFAQMGLIPSGYHIRTRYTTEGQIYMSTDSFWGPWDYNGSIKLVPVYKAKFVFHKEDGTPLSDAVVEINYGKDLGDNMSAHISYEMRTNANGEIFIEDGIPLGSNMWIHVKNTTGISYQIPNNEFTTQTNNEVYTFTAIAQ